MGNNAQAPGLPGCFMPGIFSLVSLAVSDMLFPVWMLCYLEIGEICNTVVKIFSIVASLVLSVFFCCLVSIVQVCREGSIFIRLPGKGYGIQKQACVCKVSFLLQTGMETENVKIF